MAWMKNEKSQVLKFKDKIKRFTKDTCNSWTKSRLTKRTGRAPALCSPCAHLHCNKRSAAQCRFGGGEGAALKSRIISFSIFRLSGSFHTRPRPPLSRREHTRRSPALCGTYANRWVLGNLPTKIVKENLADYRQIMKTLFDKMKRRNLILPVVF